MTREQLIEKIIMHIVNLQPECWRKEDTKKFLEEILPQPTGVDALVEKYEELYNLTENAYAKWAYWQILNDLKHLQQPTQTEEREVLVNKKPRTTDSYWPKFKCWCWYDTIRWNRYCPNCWKKIKRVD
jgi:hypothetical protein